MPPREERDQGAMAVLDRIPNEIKGPEIGQHLAGIFSGHIDPDTLRVDKVSDSETYVSGQVTNPLDGVTPTITVSNVRGGFGFIATSDQDGEPDLLVKYAIGDPRGRRSFLRQTASPAYDTFLMDVLVQIGQHPSDQK